MMGPGCVPDLVRIRDMGSLGFEITIERTLMAGRRAPGRYRWSTIGFDLNEAIANMRLARRMGHFR